MSSWILWREKMLELTHNKRLDVDWTIPTIPLFHKNKQACSLQIIWNDVAGGFDGSLREDGSIEAEIQIITGATNELGFNKMTAKTF